MSKLNQIVSDNWHVIKLFILILSALAAFVTFDQYMDTKVETRINDPAYISKISKELRPFLIFDDNGTVTYDHGAAQAVKTIHVDKKDRKILIGMKEFTQNAPLLITVGATQFSFTTKRERDNIWAFHISNITTMDWAAPPEALSSTYVLELLQ
ncbi:hypothetical protein [Desulfuromonas sp. TF]|uniref:hypothetical protein n=1 Tax=Desulfuromonas sp. TF TaxID=1232410 RepID=UPI000484C00E|nr:hypothetical protein [Desulfuromonas sp. TF]